MNKELIKTDPMATALAPVGSLDAYIAAAYSVPVLAAEEERRLAIRYHEENDVEAARKLALHNLRFVIQVARGYLGYGLALGDLVQEGNIGLLKAIKRFDPAIGVRLVSFAVHWIRAEIHEFIIRNWRIVKVATTKAQRKLFFNLRGKKKRLGWMSRAEVEQVAKDLGVKPADVLEMENRLNGREVSFDPAPGDDGEHRAAPADYLKSEDAETDPAHSLERAQWHEYQHGRMLEAMKQLDPRSLEIIKARWLSDNKTTLQQLAKRHKVSPERIRQIESQAIAQLRDAIAD
ncbi:MAG: RNA polymerase sigma factor RpoH [Gammaproteobacteria bacterium]|nr:RNA polymerase sigma factor RpoH [Gammaproteobacteria bacterium]MDD9869826.1 RNA polymerase sigma factor RpoH [Gammaproteobacteria bacterium]MDD9885821.1 RNA polymerase sigma factor RpoH [Gammaproteobacteria bacterium]